MGSRRRPTVRGGSGELSERDGTATDKQRVYLRRLLNEAFSNHHHDRTGLDPHHLDRVSAAEASRAIETLKAAKLAGWPREQLQPIGGGS